MSARLGDIVDDYNGFKALPIATGVVCTAGYWAGRRYVKTSENTWAVVFHADWRNEVARAVRERQNNISPAPHGDPYRVVLLPKRARQ